MLISPMRGKMGVSIVIFNSEIAAIRNVAVRMVCDPYIFSKRTLFTCIWRNCWYVSLNNVLVNNIPSALSVAIVAINWNIILILVIT